MGQSDPHKRENLGPTPTPLPYVKHKLYAKLQKLDLLGGSVVKNPPTNAGDVGSVPGLEIPPKIPWKRKWQPTPVFLPGKSHGQRSLVDYSPWGHKESDTTERLSMHTLDIRLSF